MRGSDKSHREQIWGLRGIDGDKTMKPGFKGLENLEQKPGWGADKGLGSRNRHGEAKVSFWGELRDKQFQVSENQIQAELGFGGERHVVGGRDGVWRAELSHQGNRYLGRRGWESGQKEVGFGGWFQGRDRGWKDRWFGGAVKGFRDGRHFGDPPGVGEPGAGWRSSLEVKG